MTTPTLAPLEPTDFDTLDQLLDELRERDDEVPQWEFLEGAMAALVCTRRPVEPAEWLPVLLGVGDLPTVPQEEGTHFASTDRYQRFMDLWHRRMAEVVDALQAPVETLEDERSYHPEVMDVRGAIAALPAEERPELDDEGLPAYAQVWALGFMFVVENWSEEWAPVRDRETAEWIDEALDRIVALTEDDTGKPSVNLHVEDGPPSVSDERLNTFGAAIWAVYDLHQIWRSLGPRSGPVRQAPTPGRNDPCPCGSGQKYKKCHGA
ncbi:UPF0149 family protein [Hydrogenophaga sp. IBVHS2]|uniref:UPF0149 family protein n=1 Tax=Hydrogenophaga sp. IBVHS2 TaxID=1985170 RepID=UPI000A2EAF17|nr:UPF0149 family protein [Hydrogenophaga sp. IBVHS2]OSZ63918.1 zinc chelation protein SecC [Hydrogenophaga sp. IBVHS2]